MCRKETVVAQTEAECYTLDRTTFTSLLGPVEDLWRFEALRKVCCCWLVRLTIVQGYARLPCHAASRSAAVCNAI